MSCEIIQLSAARPVRPASDKQAAGVVTAIGNRPLTPRQWRREGKPELPPPATETAKNSRLQIARRDAWRHSAKVTDYWQARLDWDFALDLAQRNGIADSASFPPACGGLEGRRSLVDKWREAAARQLLTPAPDLAAVAWKRAKLNEQSLPITKERIEQVIADDVAFLEAHPTRAKKDKS
jgi:hypothetical protein